MLHRIFNLRNICGTAAFLVLLGIPGAIESEMYITAVVLTAVFAVSVYLALKEDGRIK